MNRAKEGAVASAVEAAVKTYGSLDALVLNAATLQPLGPITDPSASPLSGWRTAFELNFFSLVEAVQAAAPYLRKVDQGRIIFVSSGAAQGNLSAQGPYSATKAAMNSLVRCDLCMRNNSGTNADVQRRTLGNEESDIVSVALRPGMVDTEVSVDSLLHMTA